MPKWAWGSAHNVTAIPMHDWSGLLPPFANHPADPNYRSPYRTTWGEVIQRFATSPHRISILLGLLGYRAKLRELGITSGFQWLTGSFVEQMRREPNDVDLVTFFHVPPELTEEALELAFDHTKTKSTLLCDAYLISLTYPDSSGISPEQHATRLIASTAYWYGLFSHRRDTYAWKGFVELDLHPAEVDNEVAKQLESIRSALEASEP